MCTFDQVINQFFKEFTEGEFSSPTAAGDSDYTNSSSRFQEFVTRLGKTCFLGLLVPGRFTSFTESVGSTTIYVTVGCYLIVFGVDKMDENLDICLTNVFVTLL